MLQAGFGVIPCVGSVTVDDTGIPRGARIHRFVAGFLPSTVPIQDRLRPGFAITESRLVVIGKHTKDGDSKADCRQLFRAGCSHSLRIFKAQPAEVGSMDQLWYTGIDCSHHGLWTHGMYLDPHAGFL